MAPSKTILPKAGRPTLYIDTTVMNEITVAIVNGKSVKKINQTIGFEERDDLLRYINQLVKTSKTSLKKFGSVVVVRGPGPFTAIRVGMTVANALGLALEVPVYGIKKTDSEDTVSIVKKALRVKTTHVPIRPFYDRPPNITKPKIRKK